MLIRVVERLEPGLMPRFKTMMEIHGLGWTEVMMEQMNALHKLGRTEKDIQEALHRIPIEMEVIEVLKLINARGGTQFVVSDANEFFIDTICQHHNIRCCFKGIHSNKGHFNRDGKLIVEPYHSHDCEDCPPNMCKANIVNRILRDEELSLGHRPQTVYIGVRGHGPLSMAPQCTPCSLKKLSLAFNWLILHLNQNYNVIKLLIYFFFVAGWER